jgi:hypothetical protein
MLQWVYIKNACTWRWQKILTYCVGGGHIPKDATRVLLQNKPTCLPEWNGLQGWPKMSLGQLDQLQLVPLSGSTGLCREQPRTRIFCLDFICQCKKLDMVAVPLFMPWEWQLDPWPFSSRRLCTLRWLGHNDVRPNSTPVMKWWWKILLHMDGKSDCDRGK